MSGNWYCIAFGIELGPMSHEDLARLASRGELSPDSQVRNGAAGAWVAARTVGGLFPAGSETRWFYEFMGEVLGPMKFEDLRLLADQGNLRPENRVREGAGGVWKAASAVPELFKREASAAEADVDADADFELSAPHWVSRPAAVPAERPAAKSQPAPSASVPPPADSDDADFDLGPPAKSK